MPKPPCSLPADPAPPRRWLGLLCCAALLAGLWVHLGHHVPYRTPAEQPVAAALASHGSPADDGVPGEHRCAAVSCLAFTPPADQPPAPPGEAARRLRILPQLGSGLTPSPDHRPPKPVV